MDGKRVVFLVVVMGVLLATAAWAQPGTGHLHGRVSRADGSGVGGVSVVVNETGQATLTDGNGNYSFRAIREGTYSVTMTLGDNALTAEGVSINAGQTTKLDQTVDWKGGFAEAITVFSASRRVERVVDAPAAITVVPAEQIEREASHGQLPKLLEFTPGAEVTQSGLYDYNFNTRGFNSSLNRRVATLIDGRDPSVPFLGAQEWAAIGFPLDDLASLELVRGPSAALYGANASSGVLNMVTKQPRYSQGGLLRVAAGELSTTNVDFRWATSLGGDWYLKLLGGYRESGDFTTSRNFDFVTRTGRAEYSVPCPLPQGAATDCLPQELVPLALEDDNEIIFGGIRFDKHLSNGSVFTFEGGETTVEGPAFQTGIGRVQLVDVSRPWARFNYAADHWNFLTTYNKRDAPRQLALASGNNLTLDTDNLKVEIQTNWDFADNKARIVVGGLYEDENIDSLDPRTGRQTLVFRPIENQSTAFFGQFDWSISPKVKLVLAGRWDDSDLHDSQVSPKGSLVFSINPNNTVRVTYNEAFQVANYSEFFLNVIVGAADLRLLNFGVCLINGVDCGLGVTPILALGNKDLELEEIKTLEVGYSGILGGKAYLTVDYYTAESDNFITDLLPQLGTALGRVNPNFGPWQPPAGVPAPLVAAIRSLVPLLSNNVDGSNILAAVSYTNFGRVDTQGVDLGLNYYIDDDWTFSFSYSWFDFDIQNNLPGFASLLLPNSPEHKLSTGISYVADRWDAGVSYRWVDDFRWGVGPFQGNVESYSTVDITGNYDINDYVQVGINVANATDDRHWESFGGDLQGRRALGHVAFRW